MLQRLKKVFQKWKKRIIKQLGLEVKEFSKGMTFDTGHLKQCILERLNLIQQHLFD